MNNIILYLNNKFNELVNYGPDIMLNDYLIIASIVFVIGVIGAVINRRSLISVLMSIELMLLGVNINFIAFSVANDDVTGQIYALFVLTVAAAEAAIGLALVILCSKNFGTIDLDKINLMRS